MLRRYFSLSYSLAVEGFSLVLVSTTVMGLLGILSQALDPINPRYIKKTYDTKRSSKIDAVQVAIVVVLGRDELVRCVAFLIPLEHCRDNV